LASNGGSIGIGAPACAGNEKGSRQGAFAGSREREARGFAAEPKILGSDCGRSTRTKKPGAVSRPGMVREFQFPE
jgi:hypothetical protein